MRLTDTQARTIFGFSFLASAGLIFSKLASHSFWFDEAYTSVLVRSSPSDIINYTSADVHPPLYYLLLHGWTKLFGLSDFAMRSFSAVCMLLAVMLLMFLLKRLMDRRYAYIAASFAALAPFTIRFAQEARMYAFVAALLAGATYIFVIQMQHKRRNRSWKLWILYALLITAGLYAHYFSVLIVFAHFAYALFHDTRTKDGKTWLIRLKNRISLIDRRFIKSLMLVPVLFAPWIPTLLDQFGAVNDGFWIPAVSPESVISLFVMMSVFREVFEYDVTLFASYGVLALFVWLLVKMVREATADEKKTLWFVFACFLFPMLILAAISLSPFNTSYFYWRYFAQFSLFFYAGVMFVGVLTLRYAKPVVQMLFFVPVIAMSLVGTVRVLDGVDKSNVQLNSHFEELRELRQTGDMIVADGLFDWFVADHYNDTGTPTYYIDTGYMWGSHAPIYERETSVLVAPDLVGVTPESGRVWLVEREDNPVDVPDNWYRTEQVLTGGNTTVVLYEVR